MICLLLRFGAFCCFLLLASRPLAGVTVRFNPASVEVGPFPTDFLTVPDTAQKTGLRVNLSLPDCAAQPGACQEASLVNQLDGFNLHPRIRIRFSGPVRPETLRAGIYLVWLENLTTEEPGLQPAGHVTRINQVIYDPATNTAYAKSDEVLDQHRRYILVVTSAVRDVAGDPVEADPAFGACLGSQSAYCARLAQALVSSVLRVPSRSRARPPRIVAASVFTTLSATAWLEKARAQVQNASIGFQRATPQAVFGVSDLAAFTLRRQVRANPPAFEEFTVPLPGLLLTGVGRLAFGSFRSPNFLRTDQTIPQTGTATPVTLPAATNEILFHAFLPAVARPAEGYPAVIFGHGLNDSRFGAPTLMASAFARAGFATIAINAVGHGSGPQSRVLITDPTGKTTELPAGGRSLDLNGDGEIESSEGCLIPGPVPVGLHDCLRQTALDLAQLVRAIRTGLDLDGDGVVDLDRNRIYYAGQSLGALYGTVFNAIEPEIRTAALNVGGGSVVDIGRWSPSYRSYTRTYLQTRVPPLLNRPGEFDDNYVLRDRPVKINDVPGAIEIQNVLEMIEWFQISGDPVAYAPHLRLSPLAGVPPKNILWQFAWGDRTVPNPETSQLIRTAGMREASQFYRHDRARAVIPDLPENPHTYLVDVTSLATLLIAQAVQSQIAGFFQSGGTAIPNANSLQLRLVFGAEIFETPAALPEDLNF